MSMLLTVALHFFSFVLISVNANAETITSVGYGKSVLLAAQSGVPLLGVQYFYEPTTIAFSLTATVVKSSLPAVRPLYVRFVNPQSGIFLSDWTDSGLTQQAAAHDVFTVGLTRKSTLQTLATNVLVNIVRYSRPELDSYFGFEGGRHVRRPSS